MARKKATSKRSNNEGSVYQNKRGLWVAQATIGYDENGKQIRKAVSANPLGSRCKSRPLSAQRRSKKANRQTGYGA